MSNEKTFNSEPEKDERIFKINDGLLYLIAGAIIIVSVYVFAFLGCGLFKIFGLGKVGVFVGALGGLIFSGFLSNIIHNWGVRRLEKMESKKLKDEMV